MPIFLFSHRAQNKTLRSTKSNYSTLSNETKNQTLICFCQAENNHRDWVQSKKIKSVKLTRKLVKFFSLDNPFKFVKLWKFNFENQISLVHSNEIKLKIHLQFIHRAQSRQHIHLNRQEHLPESALPKIFTRY